MNIPGEDEAILTHGLFRLSPHDPWKKIYRFQHLYAFLIYGVVSLDFVLIKDFYFFYISDFPHVKNKKHPLKEYLVLYAGKIFYLGYMILLPIVLLPFSPLQIILSFLAAHFFMGIITTLVFQTTHVIESTEFPKSSDEYDHFVYHIFATTADYSTKSRLADWFLGGLNQHVIHHLCPNVCHTHYPQLTGIVKATAEEYGIEYRENRTMLGALIKHFRLLKQLGNHEQT
jgi:linoleoyl-CoA desaturase